MMLCAIWYYLSNLNVENTDGRVFGVCQSRKIFRKIHCFLNCRSRKCKPLAKKLIHQMQLKTVCKRRALFKEQLECFLQIVRNVSMRFGVLFLRTIFLLYQSKNNKQKNLTGNLSEETYNPFKRQPRKMDKSTQTIRQQQPSGCFVRLARKGL